MLERLAAGSKKTGIPALFGGGGLPAVAEPILDENDSRVISETPTMLPVEAIIVQQRLDSPWIRES